MLRDVALILDRDDLGVPQLIGKTRGDVAKHVGAPATLDDQYELGQAAQFGSGWTPRDHDGLVEPEATKSRQLCLCSRRPILSTGGRPEDRLDERVSPLPRISFSEKRHGLVLHAINAGWLFLGRVDRIERWFHEYETGD